MNRILRVAFVFVLPFAGVVAQQLVHRSGAPGVPFIESDAETFLTPFPDPMPNAATPSFPVLPFTPFPLGDLTMNNVTGVIIATNGPLIAQYNDIRYAPLGPAFPPIPGPPIGPLTGLAINSTAGVLYCMTAGAFAACMPLPPYALLGPPMPFAFPVLAPPMMGLDWDPLTASLWSCDVAGNIYNFTPAGLPIGPQPVMLGFATTTGPAQDLVLHRHLFNMAGLYVQFTGGVVINYLTGAVQPTPILGVPPGTECGLAMHNHPATLPGACACPGPAFGPLTVGVTGPCSIGNAGFGFTVGGAPPGTPLVFGLDGIIAPIPVGGGCTFWLPFPPLFLVPMVAGPGGGAVFPAALPPLPALIGLTGYTQWAAACSTVALGVVLSDAQQFIISAP